MYFKNLVFIAIAIIALNVFSGFRHSYDDQEWLAYVNRALNQSYDQSAEPKLKKAELSLTTDYFIRFRKTYAHDMQEYYSFNLRQFNDIDYMGDINKGVLELKTMADDIIVQTYNDRRGDIDSMTTVLPIPVKNMEPDRLDSLRQAFNYFKAKGM